MKLQLTDSNLKKLERVLSIKKRVQRYRFVILIILFFVVIPILFLKIFATTTDNRNWFIGLSVLGLILILRSWFGQLASLKKVSHSFITTFNNEADLLKITTADGVLHTFSKQNSSFNIESGTPFYWGDLYGSVFSPAFFEYDWSTPEKSIYKMQVNNEHFVIQPTLFEDYKALALEIIEVAKVCKAITH